MSSSVLLRTASHQLRVLLSRTRHRVVPITETLRRSCQNDRRRRKLENVSDDHEDTSETKTKSPKLSGYAFRLFERDLESILQEQQHKEIQERDSLQRRVDLLLSLGCTMEQIMARVEVLNVSEQDILQRATVLKNAGKSATVNFLMLPCGTCSRQTANFFQRLDKFNHEACLALQCTLDEFEQMKKHHPSFNRIHALFGEDIHKKCQLLQSYGISLEEIKTYPGLIVKKLRVLERRLITLTELRNEGKVQFEQYPLQTLCKRERDYKIAVTRAKRGEWEIDGSPIPLSRIAHSLDVSEEVFIKACSSFNKLHNGTALRKIHFLLEEGLSKRAILSHIYLLRYHPEKIEAAVKQAKMVTPTPSIENILSFLRSGSLPKKRFIYNRQRFFVAALFGVNRTELPHCPEVHPVLTSDRLQLQHNFEFLVSEGFSKDDIFTCILLLAHDPDCLQAYYQDLWKRPELAVIDSSVWTDKKQTLSLLQYVIEKDMNFSSVVFHADVEYGPEQSDDKSFDDDGVLSENNSMFAGSSVDGETKPAEGGLYVDDDRLLDSDSPFSMIDDIDADDVDSGDDDDSGDDVDSGDDDD